MAAAYGARLLSEIEECSLDEVLKQLRRRVPQSHHSATGIEFIDRLATAFQTPPPPAAAPRPDDEQAPSAPQQQHQQPAPPAPSSKRQAVIEITGAGPASGKTQLLYLIAAQQLLPSRRGGLDAAASSTLAPGGDGAAIVWVDLLHTFSAARLVRVLEAQLRAGSPVHRAGFTDEDGNDDGVEDDGDTVDDISSASAIRRAARQALTHVHVVRPNSSAEAVTSIRRLRDYLLDASAHQSSRRRVGAVVVSDASAFYWQDRHEAETAAALARSAHREGEGEGEAGPAPFPAGAAAATATSGGNLFYRRWADLVAALRDLQRAFECPVVASNIALSPLRRRAAAGFAARGRGGAGGAEGREGEESRGGGEPDVLELTPHLPFAWNSFVITRILLVRAREKLPRGVGVCEALAQRSEEGKTTGEGTEAPPAPPAAVSRLRVNAWRADAWGLHVRGPVGELDRARRCLLYLGRDIGVVDEAVVHDSA